MRKIEVSKLNQTLQDEFETQKQAILKKLDITSEKHKEIDLEVLYLAAQNGDLDAKKRLQTEMLDTIFSCARQEFFKNSALSLEPLVLAGIEGLEHSLHMDYKNWLRFSAWNIRQSILKYISSE